MTKKSWTKEALKEPEKHPYIFLFFVTMATAVLGNGISGLILDTLCTWLDQYISIPLNKVGWQMIIVAILIVLLTFSRAVGK